jgi:hypothetical protein
MVVKMVLSAIELLLETLGVVKFIQEKKLICN